MLSVTNAASRNDLCLFDNKSDQNEFTGHLLLYHNVFPLTLLRYSFL